MRHFVAWTTIFELLATAIWRECFKKSVHQFSGRKRYSLFTNKFFYWYLNFANHRTKESFASTANKPLVGTLMTIGDVTMSIAIPFNQELITWSLQLPHIPVTAFSQTDLFLVWIFSNSDPHGNPSNQLQSQARTNVDMSTSCRHILERPRCFMLSEACSCRPELAYFAGKISKNRLVCKNAVAFAYYGSCRLLVMGSWFNKVWNFLTIWIHFKFSHIRTSNFGAEADRS